MQDAQLIPDHHPRMLVPRDLALIDSPHHDVFLFVGCA